MNERRKTVVRLSRRQLTELVEVMDELEYDVLYEIFDGGYADLVETTEESSPIATVTAEAGDRLGMVLAWSHDDGWVQIDGHGRSDDEGQDEPDPVSPVPVDYTVR